MTARPSARHLAATRALVLGALLVQPGLGGLCPARAAEPAGFTGLLAVRGDLVLAEENADLRFVPASVQKLLTATAALHHLGPDHRVITRIRAVGSWVERDKGPGAVPALRELRGDLVVEAAGDPTWSGELRDGDARRPLRELAHQVRAAGVVRVDGDLVIDTSRFPGRAVPLDWGRGDTALAYGAAPSALAIDENVVAVRIAPGARVGEPARLSGPEDLELVNRTTTVSPARHGKGTIDFLPVWGSPTVVVSGEYPISEGAFVVRLAAPDPVERAGRALLGELTAVGVEVSGGVRVALLPPQSPGEVLASVLSQPLSEVLELVLTDSNNWHAESVLRLLGAEVAGEGRLDTGLEVVRAFLVETAGVDPEAVVLDDGSGLSPTNLVTPRAVVTVLRFALSQPWREELLAALPSGTEGTLASWAPLPRVAAKTGTLRHTQTLAGYLLPATAGAEPIVFAVFLNHRTDASRELKREIAGRLREWSRLPVAEPVAAGAQSPDG